MNAIDKPPAEAVAAQWLHAFNAAAPAPSRAALFLADAHARDVLALGWEIRTISGADAVVALLAGLPGALRFAAGRTPPAGSPAPGRNASRCCWNSRRCTAPARACCAWCRPNMARAAGPCCWPWPNWPTTPMPAAPPAQRGRFLPRIRRPQLGRSPRQNPLLCRAGACGAGGGGGAGGALHRRPAGPARH